MAAVGAILGIVGTFVSAAGTIAAGKAQQQAAEFEAKQLEIRAKEERAAAQFEEKEFARQADFALSRQQAVAAASGLGSLDESVLDLASDTLERSQEQAAIARFGGESRARGVRAQAAARRFEGQAAKQGAQFSALGTILGGFSNMFDKYGGGGFGGTQPAFRYGYG